MQQSVSAAGPARLRHIPLTTVRRVLKPVVFIVCLVPLLLAAARAGGLAGGLGTNPVETLMDHFGQWGLRFVLITLTVTPLRKLTGVVWLGQFRRMLGLFAFAYIMAHFLVYLILDQGLALGFIVEDVIERRFITLGMLALALLTAMALTSTSGMRRRLRANWQRLHYSVYAVAVLGVWHYWWQVKKDITEPAIYGFIVLLLLGSRVMLRARTRKLNKS